MPLDRSLDHATSALYAQFVEAARRPSSAVVLVLVADDEPLFLRDGRGDRPDELRVDPVFGQKCGGSELAAS
jgi:hypothetical protein